MKINNEDLIELNVWVYLKVFRSLVGKVGGRMYVICVLKNVGEMFSVASFTWLLID